jgi:hypothetical protein
MLLAAGAALALSAATQAATNGFYVPSFRGSPGADAAGWDRFTTGVGVGNLPDLPGATTGSRATVTQLDPVGVVLGSGNIYVGIGGAARVRVDYSSLDPVGQIVLQVRTLGTEMDYSGLRLNFVSGGSPVSLPGSATTLASAPSQGFPGQNISLGYSWFIGDPTVTSFNVTFSATGEHLSLDAVTLDVLPAVPEPATWALCLAGMGVLVLSCRRR